MEGQWFEGMLQAGVVLASVVGILIGVLGLIIARRERRRGSAAWAWLLPGVAGVLIILWSLVRLLWMATAGTAA